MTLFEPLRNYCERTADTLFAEPLNAISNIAFFIAAWLLYTLYRTQGRPNRQAAILIALLTLVGIGSTLFHTFANGFTMLFDVVPIALFTFYYLWVAMRRLVGLSIGKSILAFAVFVGVASQMHTLPASLQFNGSIDYFPCLAALLIIGITLKIKHHTSYRWLLMASACFALSLSLRSVDFLVCPVLPIGTHFLWHCLNGLTLYLLVRAILTPPAR